jgi:hypothetical protein
LDSNAHNSNEHENYSKNFIKKDWDSSPNTYKDKGVEHHHVIRKGERDLMLDFLYRRNEEVLLLSGKRKYSIPQQDWQN